LPSLHPSRLSCSTEDEKETRRKPRRRVGEVEDLLSFCVSVTFDPPSSSASKRKRAARRDREAAEIKETHNPIHVAASPWSSSAVISSLEQQNIDPEALRRRREELLKQVYTSVYSFDELFTEKELQMARNQASLPAIRFFIGCPQMQYDDGD
jgi:hypothetical protein